MDINAFYLSNKFNDEELEKNKMLNSNSTFCFKVESAFQDKFFESILLPKENQEDEKVVLFSEVNSLFSYDDKNKYQDF